MKPSHPFSLSAADRTRLLGVARGLLGNPADAEDVLHEAWLRAVTGAPAELDQPLAWLTTVMKNLALDGLRRRKLEHAAAEGRHDVATPSAEDEAELRQRCEHALRHLANTLSPTEAAMLLLHEVFGHSHADIARRAGKSEAACRQAVHRALLRLRQSKGDEPEDHATADALHVLCLRALQQHSPAPLHAILAAPISASAALNAASARSGVVQLEGGYALVLVHEGRLLCCLPLGPVATAST
jgi:RNA polymerase sigma factor (sigma-70 family)